MNPIADGDLPQNQADRRRSLPHPGLSRRIRQLGFDGNRNRSKDVLGTFWEATVEPQLIIKDLRVSRAGDEVHNSEVEECNLILSPTAVFSESRFQRTNPAPDR
jgi:hypothetical protein